MFLGVMEADFSKTTLYEPTDAGFVESFQVTGTLNVLSLLNQTGSAPARARRGTASGGRQAPNG